MDKHAYDFWSMYFPEFGQWRTLTEKAQNQL